jgi:hypothetical protein
VADEPVPAGFRWFRRVTLGRERKPADMLAVRKSGGVADIRRSLGLGDRRPPDPMADSAAGWRPWP